MNLPESPYWVGQGVMLSIFLPLGKRALSLGIGSYKIHMAYHLRSKIYTLFWCLVLYFPLDCNRLKDRDPLDFSFFPHSRVKDHLFFFQFFKNLFSIIVIHNIRDHLQDWKIAVMFRINP